MRVHLITLFPEFFAGPLGASVLGRAVTDGLLEIAISNPRDWATNRHRTVDDTPYGGGAGMVLRAPEVSSAIRAARQSTPGPVIYLTPQGRRFDQSVAQGLMQEPGMILLCGRYEGIDERAIVRDVDVELSVGDFVLSGGEPAALCVVDAVARLLPGALGNTASPEEESFQGRGLEYPHFTRPASWEGMPVPDVLTSGHHGRVDHWRARVTALRTAARRPDLLSGDDVPRWGDDPLDAEIPAWMFERRHGVELSGIGWRSGWAEAEHAPEETDLRGEQAEERD